MSFKRKTPSRDTQPTSRLFSTGIPSLDDILGGGLPASCSLVITAPDLHTDYGELVQKYFVAQGLACGQRVCVIGDVEWVHGCMWLSAVASNDTDESRSSDEKIKIAWRYEQMKQFQTTVASPVVTGSENCHTFDLSVRIPPSVVLDAVSSNLLTIVSIASPAQVLDSLQGLLASNDAPLRICIPSFASPYWGDLNSQDILRFFHGLRRLLRRYPNACASTNLVAEASVDSGLHEKLGWVLDGAITLSAFAADPALAAAFPTLHGLVQIHALPAPRGFVPASDRFSTLRGGEAGGENNLGFKCTRKRLILETLHLDVEGGVSERRTNAPAVSGPAVTIEVEGSKKGRKKVGFQSDRPELYDFCNIMARSGIERGSWISLDSAEENEPLSSPSGTMASTLSLNSPLTADSNKNLAVFPGPHSFARPPKTLPDPTQFPPYRQQLSSTPPALSSSSSASTRSSAYTSNGSALVSGDYNHVRVASGDPDDDSQAIGITSDSVVQLMESENRVSTGENSHWSESYSSSRSRASSVGNNSTDFHLSPRLQQKKSYDMGWQHTLDERDEFGASEEETDEEHLLLGDDDDQDDDERTSAALIAEEGRGLIVQGEGMNLSDIQVHPGTTHLLLGSSSTPNTLPTFLTCVIPPITTSLLALDISANFLNALPPTLALCICLEELNIASNPLRVLPVFLADLLHLRVLIADSTGISTLPDTLVDLEKLHTISVRRNKMHALPSWLSLLPALQTVYVDGNPFQGPWKALVEPLLAKVPSTPVYPPSTPMFPLNSPSSGDADTDEELSEPPSSSSRTFETLAPEEEDHTITARSPSQAPGLVRTRTTPNRAHHPISRQESPQEDPGYFADHEVRRMKSAGELRLNRGAGEPSARPPLQTFATSRSSTNLLSQTPPRPGLQKRYGSVGPATMLDGSPSHNAPGSARLPLTRSMWETPGGDADSSVVSQSSQNISPPRAMAVDSGNNTVRAGKEKNSRWGFLKKMSMGKMKMDPPSPRPSPPQIRHMARPPGTAPPTTERFNQSPQISMRISTTGNLDAFTAPAIQPPPVVPEERPLASSPPSSGNNLLVPPPTTSRAKRRSFLPIDGPPALNIPIPEASTFIPGVTATNDIDVRGETPSPVVDSYNRREEERAREAYQRALRSVMAYLKDMNDLGLSQQATGMGVYGANGDEVLLPRSRRPTGTGLEREASVSSNGSSIDSGQLRSLDSLSGVRTGSSTQTNSVATTDSSGSGEERKFKDDKGKRAMVIREIVVTERTYVQGLQELVDIYIKPGSAPVNVLGSSSKETVVPASERKVIFGGIESLFSFHKESFLPALEIAAAPLMKSNAELVEADADGQLSLSVAKAIGNMFLKHAAFMRMYSSYINNFDNAVQRVKAWTISTGPSGTTPAMAQSTSQLAGLGLTLSAISSPHVPPDAGATAGMPQLSTSQRKRLRSYLKRCRMNPRHSQLTFEAYLLLPVQRIPRYRLLLEELLRSTPPTYEYMDDPLDRSLAEISLLANNMNEGKRESESRRKLVQWQARIRGKFPSPLVQPHRRLIMDGQLLLTRVVRKAMVSFESINAQGDPCTVQVDCLAPELTPRALVGILCNDLLVLCRDPSQGQDPNSYVDLWAVLRMQTLPQPASIVHGNALRLVDNKAILYFDAPSPLDALNWYRAINLNIPRSG